jgi:hypothetical protein
VVSSVTRITRSAGGLVAQDINAPTDKASGRRNARTVGITVYATNAIASQRTRFETLSDGSVRNDYTLKILNKTREAPGFALALEGIAGARVVVDGVSIDSGGALELPTRPDAVATWRVHVTAPRAALHGESSDVTFVLRSRGEGTLLRHGSVFFGPREAGGNR